MSTPEGASAGSQVHSRYGNTRSNKFTGRIIVIIFVIAVVAVAAYMISMFRNMGAADVTAVESGGSIVSDNRLQLRVDVTRTDPSQDAYCIVTALDYDKNEVGRREFVIPAGGEEVTRHNVDINTRERGYAGTVYGCSATLPDYLIHD